MDANLAFLIISIAITLILVLPRFKVNIAISILIGAIFLLLTLGADFLSVVKDLEEWKNFWRIIFIVFLSLLLVSLMEKIGYLKVMVKSIKAIFSSLGGAMVTISAFIGLLPMPGGAYVSARLVDPIAREMKLNSIEATTLNYWFRHLWEYWWPLYTGVIVASAIFNIEIFDFIIHMCFLSLLAILGGYIFIYYPIMRRKNVKKGKSAKNLGDFIVLLYSIWPILGVMVLALGFRIDLFYSLLVIDMVLIGQLFIRRDTKNIARSLKFALNPIFLGVTFAALFMKIAVIETNSMVYTYTFFNTYGIPPVVVIILLPYLAGLMTGVTVAYVSATFPLLLAYPMSYPAIALAYASGYGGHLTSPVHLCLVLSAKHFNADIFAVIKKVIPSVIFVVGFTLFLYFMGWG